MARLRILPDDRAIDTVPGEPVLRASLRAGVPHANECGGEARCSTCRVHIVAGLEHCPPRNAKERVIAERLHFAPAIRLACQTVPSGDVTVRRLVLDADDIALTDQRLPGAPLRLAGEEKRVAILFADIRGFTPLAERLLAYDAVHLLNRYFQRVEAVIREHRGYVDNYMGDGLLAVFGGDEAGEAALDAVRAGLGMLEAVEKLRPYFEAAYGVGIRIGVGVHYGEVVLGSIGAPNAARTSAIGDAVNFASRIERANKQTGTSFLISAEAYARVGSRIGARKIDNFSVPGKSTPCTLYEVLGLAVP